MKKLLLSLAMFALLTGNAFALSPNDWRYMRRDPSNLFNVIYDVTTPASTAFMMLDVTSGVTTPKHILLGSGLSYDGTYVSVSGISAGSISGLATVATTGNYSDLIGAPSIPAAQIQADWTQASTGALDFVKHKPSLAAVATTGAYADLSGKPSLATVATSGSYSDLTGKPSLATVASSGAYTDLTGTPTLSAVSSSGDYNDLLNKPTIPAAQKSVVDGVVKTGSYPVAARATVSGANAVFYLTDDETATGNAVCPNHVYLDSMMFRAEEGTTPHSFGVPGLTNTNRTVTIAVSKLSSLLGILTLNQSATGSVVKATVICD